VFRLQVAQACHGALELGALFIGLRRVKLQRDRRHADGPFIALSRYKDSSYHARSGRPRTTTRPGRRLSPGPAPARTGPAHASTCASAAAAGSSPPAATGRSEGVPPGVQPAAGPPAAATTPVPECGRRPLPGPVQSPPRRPVTGTGRPRADARQQRVPAPARTGNRAHALPAAADVP